jgi:hypothetical protein
MTNQNKIVNLIKESSENKREYKLYNISIWIKDSLPKNIRIENIISSLQERLPRHTLGHVDIIYIGQFDHLKSRQVNSSYMDASIYVTNEQDNEGDIIDDIVHEIAHSLEEKYNYEIYSDDQIRDEFLRKRKRMKRVLSFQGVETETQDFFNTEYSIEFDKYLYKDTGYETLHRLVGRIFNSPYAATSLREYFANGFEAYYLGNRERLLKISPLLFAKIKEIDEIGE